MTLSEMLRGGLAVAVTTACASVHPAVQSAPRTVAPAQAPVAASAPVSPDATLHRARVERRALTRRVMGPVTLAPAATVVVTAPESGVAEALLVDVNDVVHRGQEVARIRAHGRVAVVRSPREGVVLARHVELGAPVTESQTRIVTVVDVSSLEGRVQLPEANAIEVHVGQPVALCVEAMPGRVYASVVSRVEAAMTAEHTLPVTFLVANPDRSLRPGMAASAAVIVQVIEEALTVPVAAITERDGATVVFAVRDGHAVAVPVRPTMQADGVVALDDPSMAGQEVVIPAAAVHEGDAVPAPE